ncbi:MAG: hypothetical protein AAFQ63_01930 [Cyanobacteria bacterium J06621_11]
MNFSFKSVLYFFFPLLVVSLLWIQPEVNQPKWVQTGLYPAKAAEVATGLVDPRFTRLESKVNALQAQVNRLQSQLSQSGSGNGSGGPVAPYVEPSAVSGEFPNGLSLDEQFDNLATLVIEMNQRIMQIERELTDLN